MSSRIELVLSRLKDHELFVSPKKCEFLKDEIGFLGLVVGTNGLHVDTKKVDVLKSWPKPSTLTCVCSCLGLIQFFRRFIKKFSALAAPLTNLTKKHQGMISAMKLSSRSRRQ